MRSDTAVRYILALIVVTGLATVLVVPFAADAAVRQVALSSGSWGQGGTAEPGPMSPDLGLRRLPLVEPEGAVEKAFGQGSWRDSQKSTRRAITDVARSSGLERELAELWPAMSKAAKGVGDNYYDREFGDHPERWYPVVRKVVLAWPDSRIRAQRGALNELAASLLIASSSHGAGDWGTGAGTSAGALVLFDRLRQVNPSCDAEVNYALTLSLGQHPREAALRPVTKRMLAACPSDGNAAWLASEIAESLHWVERAGGDLLIEDESARAEVTRAFIVGAFETAPDGPLRSAAEGFFVLQRAEKALAEETMPFTARERAKEALTLFRDARSKADHPALMAAEARALAVLGDLVNANMLLASAAQLAPETGIIQTLRAEQLERAGDWEQAVRHAKPIYPASGNLSLAPTGFGLDPTWDPVQLAVTDAAPTWVMDPTFQSGAGGLILDLSALPAYRTDRFVTAPRPAQTQVTSCPATGQIRRLLVVGRYADALRVYDDTVGVLASKQWRNTYGESCERPVALAAVAAQLASDSQRRDRLLAEGDGVSLDEMFDVAQNVLRYGKAFEKAVDVTSMWAQASPGNGLSHHRAAEIHYLTGNLAEADAAFSRAVERYGQALPGEEVPGYWRGDPDGLTQLVAVQRGIIAEQQGDAEAARSAFTGVAAAALDYSEVYSVAREYALLQLGILELRDNRPEAAAAALGEIASPDMIAAGPVANNLALALALSDRGAEAVPIAQRAVDEDPANPIYLETLALAQQASGDKDAAQETYARATEKDPSLFTASNNEAILLAGDGKLDEARARLQASLSANPGYAKAWANLAMVELARGTPDGYLRAVGAQAIATGLDLGLRGVGYGWQVELGVYDTGIDLSRPLPPEWSFAKAASPVMPGLTFVMVLLVMLRLAQTFASESVSGWVSEKLVAATHWLGGRTGGWLGGRVGGLRLPQTTPGWVTTVIAAAMAVMLSAQAPDFSLWEHLTLGMGMLGLVAGFSLTRRFVAGHTVTERTWWPLVIVAAVVSALSLPLLPIPSLEGPASRTRIARLGGLLFLASVAVSMVVVALISGSPVARAIAVSAVMMAATALLPFKQMDGQAIAGRWLNVTISVVLLAFSIAFAMLWL